MMWFEPPHDSKISTQYIIIETFMHPFNQGWQENTFSTCHLAKFLRSVFSAFARRFVRLVRFGVRRTAPGGFVKEPRSVQSSSLRRLPSRNQTCWVGNGKSSFHGVSMDIYVRIHIYIYQCIKNVSINMCV